MIFTVRGTNLPSTHPELQIQVLLVSPYVMGFTDFGGVVTLFAL